MSIWVKIFELCDEPSTVLTIRLVCKSAHDGLDDTIQKQDIIDEFDCGEFKSTLMDLLFVCDLLSLIWISSQGCYAKGVAKALHKITAASIMYPNLCSPQSNLCALRWVYNNTSFKLYSHDNPKGFPTYVYQMINEDDTSLVEIDKYKNIGISFLVDWMGDRKLRKHAAHLVDYVYANPDKVNSLSFREISDHFLSLLDGIRQEKLTKWIELDKQKRLALF